MENNSYINLARKYRPQTINHLIGQDSIIQTLQNSFDLNKIAHAFIFTGTRGVGKTTTARIMAKALNCVGEDGNGKITLNPCGKCSACQEITSGSCMDVIELDAASKTSVDDAREIIETSRYKPISVRYKVFIIDEVHMLSKSAFNALLKTLEEPPPHVKFIFATTEIKKIPITVLSRCQRFNLSKVETPILEEHIKNICNQENVSYDSESIQLICNHAGGSVRDSLSILDQAIVYCDNSLNINAVMKMLGVGSRKDNFDIFDKIISQDNSAFIQITQKLKTGISPLNILEDLLEVCHYCSLFSNNINLDITSLTESEKEHISVVSNKTTLSNLIKVWQILHNSYNEIKVSANQEMFLNMALLQVMFSAKIGDLSKIIKNLSKSTENKVENSSAPIVYPNMVTEPSINHASNNSPVSNNSQEEDINSVVESNFPGAKFVTNIDE